VIGSEFRVVDYQARVDLKQGARGVFSDGVTGVSMEYRDFDIGGLVFTEPTTSVSFSGYSFQELTRGRFGLEFGARAGYDRITPEQDNPDAGIGYVRRREFWTYSLSLTAMYEIAGRFYVGGNLSRSSRVPTIEELFSQGPHLAAYSYEVGNPDLKSERGVGAELFAFHDGDRVQATANLFYNDLDSYIIPYNTGETNYQTFLPIYATQGVGARLYGFEAQVAASVTTALRVQASLGMTRGEYSSDGSPLPQIPPAKGKAGVQYSVGAWIFGGEMRGAWRQDRVSEFEAPTAGYAVGALTVEYAAPLGAMVQSVTMSLDNILDQEYRNHLSRVKSVLPEAGRSVRLSWKLFL